MLMLLECSSMAFNKIFNVFLISHGVALVCISKANYVISKILGLNS